MWIRCHRPALEWRCAGIRHCVVPPALRGEGLRADRHVSLARRPVRHAHGAIPGELRSCESVARDSFRHLRRQRPAMPVVLCGPGDPGDGRGTPGIPRATGYSVHRRGLRHHNSGRRWPIRPAHFAVGGAGFAGLQAMAASWGHPAGQRQPRRCVARTGRPGLPAGSGTRAPVRRAAPALGRPPRCFLSSEVGRAS